MLRGEERVRGVRGRQRMGGQGVGRGHRVHRQGSRVGRMRDGLGEDQVRVGVDPSAAGRVEAVEERVHGRGAGVGIAERRRPDGLLRARGGQGRAVFGHQRLDSEAALGGGLKHPGAAAAAAGLPFLLLLLRFGMLLVSRSGESPSLDPRGRARQRDSRDGWQQQAGTGLASHMKRPETRRRQRPTAGRRAQQPPRSAPSLSRQKKSCWAKFCCFPPAAAAAFCLPPPPAPTFLPPPRFLSLLLCAAPKAASASRKSSGGNPWRRSARVPSSPKVVQTIC